MALRILLTLVSFAACTASKAGHISPAAGQMLWKQEDISYFRQSFLDVDRSFSPAARAAAEIRLSRLERESGSIDPTDFAVELCRIAALADNGHTECLPAWVGRNICKQVAPILSDRSQWCLLRDPDFQIPAFQNVSIAFYPFGGTFNVVGAAARNSDLLGARLSAVNGRSVESIRDVLCSFVGGTPAHRELKAADVLASPEQLHAVGLSGSSRAVTYEFVMPSGRQVRRRLEVAKPSATQEPWRQLPDPDHAPWAFQEAGTPFRFRDAPTIDGVIVQLRQNSDADNQRINDFLEYVETQRSALARTNVVLDMRFNGGGNLLLTRDFLRQWPARVPGRFFVLTSRQTFSAAIASIAYLKQAGDNRVSIIGESIGDRLMFFSDGLPIQLPHSGLFLLPATVRMDYRDGCRHYDDCFEGIAQPGGPTATSPFTSAIPLDRLPISVVALEPDIVAPWTIESWLTGNDPMMDAVATLVIEKAKQ